MQARHAQGGRPGWNAYAPLRAPGGTWVQNFSTALATRIVSDMGICHSTHFAPLLVSGSGTAVCPGERLLQCSKAGTRPGPSPIIVVRDYESWQATQATLATLFRHSSSRAASCLPCALRHGAKWRRRGVCRLRSATIICICTSTGQRCFRPTCMQLARPITGQHARRETPRLRQCLGCARYCRVNVHRHISRSGKPNHSAKSPTSLSTPKTFLILPTSRDIAR